MRKVPPLEERDGAGRLSPSLHPRYPLWYSSTVFGWQVSSKGIDGEQEKRISMRFLVESKE